VKPVSVARIIVYSLTPAPVSVLFVREKIVGQFVVVFDGLFGIALLGDVVSIPI